MSNLLTLSPMFAGVLGNFLVIFALIGDKKARNATSSFLVSLAAADLLFLLICIPYNTAAQMTGYWSAGRPLCKVRVHKENCQIPPRNLPWNPLGNEELIPRKNLVCEMCHCVFTKFSSRPEHQLF